jgi:predicted aldo/keto reductase-like oxidoreductase
MKKLGFGAMRLPLTNPDDATSIDMAETCRMVDAYLAAGFCYFDTAYMYHQHHSEGALKKALVERHKRDSYLLADKMPAHIMKPEETYEEIFEIQLARTGVEYFDYYLLHNMGKVSYADVQKRDGFGFLQKVKAEGKARKIGFSFHDDAELLDKILTEHPETEFVQLQINYSDWESPSIQSRLCYEVARKHGKEIIVMEPVRGGSLANLPKEAEVLLQEAQPEMSIASWAIRYAASLPGVIMVLSGMSNLAQVEDNTSYMQSFAPLNENEQGLIKRVVDILKKSEAIPCTGCQYCEEDCPRNINISAYFSVYNAYTYRPEVGLVGMKMKYTRSAEGRGKIADCIDCKICEGNCPQHLDITGYFPQVAEIFES